MSRAWTKVINTQLKDLTSDDLSKLGQLMFVDPKAITEFEQLNLLTQTAKTLQSPGQEVLADGIAVQTYSINNSSATIKPSTIFDASTDPYADTYLCKVVALSATFSDAGAALTAKLKDTVALMRGVSSVAATQDPLLLYNPDGTYFNESNPIVIAESGSVATTIEVAVAIVARGGAQ